eukprot:1934834-Rhodomonas_salina.2
MRGGSKRKGRKKNGNRERKKNRRKKGKGDSESDLLAEDAELEVLGLSTVAERDVVPYPRTASVYWHARLSTGMALTQYQHRPTGSLTGSLRTLPGWGNDSAKWGSKSGRVGEWQCKDGETSARVGESQRKVGEQVCQSGGM